MSHSVVSSATQSVVQ